MNVKALMQKVMDAPGLGFAITVLQRFGGDNGGLFAAGLAFFMLLSFAPLVLTATAVLAFFIHDPAQTAHMVKESVQGMFPSGAAQEEINHFLTQRLNVNQQVSSLVRGRALAGIIGFITLLWTSIQIFVNASSAMNAAFEVKEKRSWLLLRGVALGLLVVSGILVTTTLFLSAAPSALSRFTHFIPPVNIPVWILTVIFEILAVLVNAVLYLLIYRFLPSTNVTWKAAFAGGLTASIFWEIAKKGLAAWLLKPNHSMYGDLANLILFVLWIYYSMMIMLIGAEVAAVYQKTGSFARRKARFGQKSQDGEEQVHHSQHPTRDEVIRKGSKGVGAEMT